MRSAILNVTLLNFKNLTGNIRIGNIIGSWFKDIKPIRTYDLTSHGFHLWRDLVSKIANQNLWLDITLCFSWLNPVSKRANQNLRFDIKLCSCLDLVFKKFKIWHRIFWRSVILALFSKIWIPSLVISSEINLIHDVVNEIQWPRKCHTRYRVWVSLQIFTNN